MWNSPLLTDHLVVRADDEQVSVATLIRYHHPLAPRIRLPLSTKHLRLLPGLLRNAQRAQQPTPR